MELAEQGCSLLRGKSPRVPKGPLVQPQSPTVCSPRVPSTSPLLVLRLKSGKEGDILPTTEPARVGHMGIPLPSPLKEKPLLVIMAGAVPVSTSEE